MARGDTQTAGRRRAPPTSARIAARLAKFAHAPQHAVGVQPLNPGFFQLERMRAETVAKARAENRGKVRSR